MQVVILAGGLGTRMQQVSRTVPKSMLPVAGKPFVDHQLDLLQSHGLHDVLFCIGYLGEQIEEHLSDGSSRGLSILYAREDPDRLLGTGGALVHALPLLQESFLLMYGDSYLPTDYRRVTNAFETCGEQAMMCVHHNKGRWDPSNVRIEGDKVVFYSKAAAPGETEYIDYGLSAYRRSVIEACADADTPLDLATIQEGLVHRRALAALEVKERFYEIGKPKGLDELDTLLSRSQEADRV